MAMEPGSRSKPGKTLSALPAIPEKQYFSISEAATLCGVKAHVLRYWEQEFGSSMFHVGSLRSSLPRIR
ncbi:MerR family transcriptional regulator [Acidithiobacillus sp. AMEEHan]|uniref:MerR family transcriptional regulator n=1 Tax=Acidithiobacillus sp. AMEEHan TaxID=2994951 RepID=UPI0027E3C043|nr:MerR family transcriptional regulator [Acidithiobacillus sp. AMEEHan]